MQIWLVAKLAEPAPTGSIGWLARVELATGSLDSVALDWAGHFRG